MVGTSGLIMAVLGAYGLRERLRLGPLDREQAVTCLYQTSFTGLERIWQGPDWGLPLPALRSE